MTRALVLILLAGAAPAPAQVRISSLPGAAALTGAELMPGVQGGANVAITPSQIKTFTGVATPGGGSGNIQYNNSGSFAGGNLSGDCGTTALTITCTKTNGAAFGTAATQNTGTSGATIPLLNGNNIESGAVTFTGSVSLGTATAATINGDTFTTGTYTLTGSAGKTLTFANSLSFAGTDATTFTFPAATGTVATLNAAQSFTGTETFSAGVINFNATGTLQAQSVKLGSGSVVSTCAEAGTGSPTCAVTASAGSFTEQIALTSSGSATSLTITFPNAVSRMYICDGFDATTTTERLKQTGGSATTAILTYYNDAGTAAPPGATDVLYLKCLGN